MIKITNDKYEFKVTKGVFEDKFKPLGYRVVEEKNNTIEKTIVKENVDSVDNIDKKEEKNDFIKKEEKVFEKGTTEKLQKNRK
jgi:hypothetical protein